LDSGPKIFSCVFAGTVSKKVWNSGSMKRYLEVQVRRDLEREMVFVGGARQVRKTTLALNILGRSAARLPIP
jgi:hypothetical protein